MPNIRSSLPPCSRIFVHILIAIKFFKGEKIFQNQRNQNFNHEIFQFELGKSTIVNANNLQRSRTVRAFRSPKWNQSLISKEE
jgi:hypothetical protein